tara:strand:- start:249 stop:689 length:441 start_codon:yes stop_codon:yes gene_type:complete
MTDQLYTQNGCLPRRLPEMMQLSDGTVITRASTYTEEQIADVGWVLAPDYPQTDPSTQKVSWNEDTVQWDVLPLSDEEIEQNNAGAWSGIRHERNELLSETDYIVLRAYENGTAVPTEWATYRQALRDLPSTSTDFNSVAWPTRPE